MSEIKDKIIVITGAGGTICSSLAKALAAEGACLVLVGRTVSKVEALAGEISEQGGHAIGLAGDVTREGDMRKILAACQERWGDPDVLINGAGGKDLNAVTETVAFEKSELDGESRGFFNLDLGALSGEIQLNTIGTIIPSQIFGAAIAKKGKGSIINFASMNSYRPLSRMPGYALAKAGIINFTQWLAAYLGPAGIRVNAVAPGFVVNDRSRKLLMTAEGGFSERGKQVIAHTPMARFGQADELTGVIRWLIDDDQAAFVTGVCIPVDGGFLASSGL